MNKRDFRIADINAFNTYFANIGKNLSSQIDQNNVTSNRRRHRQQLTVMQQITNNI